MNQPITQWARDERPREKLLHKGAAALSNAELLAILINTGTRDKSAVDIATDILQSCQQNLLELGKLSFQDLNQIKGVGEKKSLTLLAALELGKRRQLELAIERPKLSSSRDSFHVLAPYFLDKSNEVFYVLFLNAGNKLLRVEFISHGGLTATVVDTRIIFKKALEQNGVTQIILAHNHPSGNLTPSDMDKRLTQKVKEGGQWLDITLLDHIIVAGNEYYSFCDNGLL